MAALYAVLFASAVAALDAQAVERSTGFTWVMPLTRADDTPIAPGAIAAFRVFHIVDGDQLELVREVGGEVSGFRMVLDYPLELQCFVATAVDQGGVEGARSVAACIEWATPSIDEIRLAPPGPPGGFAVR